MVQDYQKSTIETYNSFADTYTSMRKHLLLDAEIRRFEHLIHGKDILEVGCGPGRDAAVFVKHGYRVTGVDLSERFIEIAMAKVPSARFMVMDALSLEFSEGSFDGVWACASLLHLKRDDLPVALSEISRVLRAGGAFFMSLKKGAGEELVIDKDFGNSLRFFTYYNEKEARSLLEGCGFGIVEMLVSNERERFREGRDTDWIVCFCKKI